MDTQIIMALCVELRGCLREFNALSERVDLMQDTVSRGRWYNLQADILNIVAQLERMDK